jgi:hypothetical protein
MMDKPRAPEKRLVQFLVVSLLWVMLAQTALAQSALDGCDPNANGVVRVVVLQPDGKILLGGDFTMLAPNGGPTVMRNRIARLDPDGTLDSTFDPNANNTVNSIAVQAGGKIVAGGSFTAIGGQQRNRIARLEATTGSADAFDANATDAVLAIALQADGKIVAGGFFTNIGGQPRSRLARLVIVSPSNGTSTKVLVRALGPTLAGFGVPNPLTNPTLDLVNSSGTTIRSNDNWKDDPQQRSEIEAANLAPSHDEEAALVQIVAPGAYTAVVRGSGRTTGVGLVEVYNIQ